MLYGVLTVRQYSLFQEARDEIGWRVHVNGIRGKSTVTRYLAAIFRASGHRTFAKTTGTAARIIRPDGSETVVQRRGLPNVNEQLHILRSFSAERADAAVMECMAVNPVYAEWLEHKVMDSNLGVLTNVRLDHTDYLGETLPDIARALARAIPSHALLITAEQNPDLLALIRSEAERVDTHLLVADPSTVGTESLIGFNHFALESNVAIGFIVADILGLKRSLALKAMQTAAPDPGAFRIQEFRRNGQVLSWANLFAVNDRESFVALCTRLFDQHPDHQKVVILNNRHDRQTRVQLFAELAAQLGFDQAVSFGDFEAEVNAVLKRHQLPVLNLGNSSQHRQDSGEKLLNQIMQATSPTEPVLLIGTVNIHTPQAERLLHALKDAQPCS
ncbi:MAG: poly-gamma-glutamate synthase PgsB [Cyanobacteriota bacterium]|nr:poly-gamma-glutamate synthase PgsB [Cyanobacteriota bacterium]